MQILIELVKTNEVFSHIKIIELQDNSIKKCYGIGLQLKYLRTITDGIPYYAKFGFLPNNEYNSNVYLYNKNKHINNCTLKNEDIDELFTSVKEKYKNLYEHYKKYLRVFVINNKKIDICEFIRKLIDTENSKIFPSSEKKSSCELVAEILYPLYKKLGYEEYDKYNDLWILKIKRK